MGEDSELATLLKESVAFADSCECLYQVHLQLGQTIIYWLLRSRGSRKITVLISDIAAKHLRRLLFLSVL